MKTDWYLVVRQICYLILSHIERERGLPRLALKDVWRGQTVGQTPGQSLDNTPES